MVPPGRDCLSVAPTYRTVPRPGQYGTPHFGDARYRSIKRIASAEDAGERPFRLNGQPDWVFMGSPHGPPSFLMSAASLRERLRRGRCVAYIAPGGTGNH